MSSTPLICCSIGAATVASMTSALAPGYTAVICTCGGVISGYIAIGSWVIVIAPASRITSEMTMANLGLEIKKLLSTRRTSFALGDSRYGVDAAARRDVL